MNFSINNDKFLDSTNNPGSQIIVDYNWKPNSEIIKEISNDFENDFENNLGNDLGNIVTTKSKNGNIQYICYPNFPPNNVSNNIENRSVLINHCSSQTSDTCNSSQLTPFNNPCI